MKAHIIIILLILLAGCGPTQTISDPELLDQLHQLKEDQDFFKLRTTFSEGKDRLSPEHSLYYTAMVSAVFNEAEVSNAAINALLSRTDIGLSDSLLNKVYRQKLLNHINLYEYGEAAQTSALIQEQFADINDSLQMENFKNEMKIWSALKDVPKQQVVKSEDVMFPMYRDKVGLLNVDVTMQDSTINFLFDTGANFSVIIESLAAKLGLSIIEADFYVTAATGMKVKSKVAVAEELQLGDVTVRNAVFLIVKDEDLSFPQIEYYINGAIGFPIIEALEEIRINANNEILVPQIPEDYGLDNFALNGLMPIVAVNYNGDLLRFHFDTGATTTSLYPKFFHEYKEEIEANFEIDTFSAGSGGGHVDFPGYIIDSMQLGIGQSETTITDVRLHIEDIGGDESNFHGNFGQDYIKQFDEMIISFKHASVLFR
ncbi:MAG: hypothetical protein GY751_14765 [Bacteroidetes bacterium]|nr:hypothetical protein [Bacteroidota bacterium]